MRNDVAPSHSTSHDDDKQLLALGYEPSFKREFSNLATVCNSTRLSRKYLKLIIK